MVFLMLLFGAVLFRPFSFSSDVIHRGENDKKVMSSEVIGLGEVPELSDEFRMSAEKEP